MSGNINNRKHYRVYAKKHTPKAETCITVKSNKMMFGIGMVCLAFLKGILLGYILKDRHRR